MSPPPDETPTLWDHPRQQAEEVAARVVALGLLDRARVDEALRRYDDQAPPIGFSSFLVQAGLVGLDALDALQEAAPAPAGASLDVPPGAHVSGCVIERELGRGGMGVVPRRAGPRDRRGPRPGAGRRRDRALRRARAPRARGAGEPAGRA